MGSLCREKREKRKLKRKIGLHELEASIKGDWIGCVDTNK